MIKIEKHDIKKLEEYIQHIDNYRRELKMREYELLESHEPDNAGAGKSNLPGNPIERCAIKKFSDNRYNTLRNIVNGVDRLIDESDALNHSIDQLYQHLGERYYSSNMASRMEQFRDEFHFAKRRSTEALYEQQQQIQHGIRKVEEEMIDLEMRRNVEIETVTKEENKWKQ